MNDTAERLNHKFQIDKPGVIVIDRSLEKCIVKVCLQSWWYYQIAIFHFFTRRTMNEYAPNQKKIKNAQRKHTTQW